MADGSTSGPYPVTTPRDSSLASRACTVPRATPSRREISSSPTRGCSRRAAMRRASSASMVKVTREYGLGLVEVARSAQLRCTELATAARGGGVSGMFEEGQLYSPVTADDDGAVTVHLAHDHPGANDPAYRARRNEIATAAHAWQPGQPNPHIDYSQTEQEVWRTVCRELWPKWEHYAINDFREAV